MKTLEWKIAPEKVDYHHYLPVFIEGPPPAAVDDVLIQPCVRSYFSMEIIDLYAFFIEIVYRMEA